MRRLIRPTLDAASVATLAKMQTAVNAAPVPKEKAATLWGSRGSKPRRAAFEDVRGKLEHMAGPTLRCAYCEDSRGTDIDHFRPKSTYPGFAFVWANYFLACSYCNSNEKRAQFPLDAARLPLLLDPVADDPFLHLVFVEKTGFLSGITPQGAETEKVFRLNGRLELTLGRQTTWLGAIALLRDLGRARSPVTRKAIVGALRSLPLQAVVFHLLRDADGPIASVPKDVAQVVRQTRAEWVGDYL